MQWQFTLDTTIIDEPLGFSDIAFNIIRDEQWHGIMFEAATSSLKFYGTAFDYLKAAKTQYGVDATVIFTASVRCEGETEYTEAISGKLNFGQYTERCGSDCLISAPVEQNDCTMILKNRFDQKVNVDNFISFSGTVLPQYNGLGFTMPLAAQEIPISADGSVADAGDGGVLTMQGNGCNLLVRPVYGVVRDASIDRSELDSPANFFQDCLKTFLLSPQVLIEENSQCVSDQWTYNVRLKGSFILDTDFNTPNAPDRSCLIEFVYWDGLTGDSVGHPAGFATIIDQFLVEGDIQDGVTYNFDTTFAGTTTIPNGSGVYMFLDFFYAEDGFPTHKFDLTYNFDPQTSFLLSNTKVCPPTDCQVYMVNETLSRLAESITDRCLTVKSDYYGRTDSEPYASTTDGCGGLRILTSGLKIRQAVGKEFFVSLKDTLEGLRAIDNIGMGIEGSLLRIEPVEYFYNNTLLLTIDLIPDALQSMQERLIYSRILIGYKKWEIKSVKGIDEFNSSKEFRTGIKSVSNTLDMQSGLISAGYIIETLRSTTLATSGNADNSYDNETFIVCVVRDGMAYYQYAVEQGVIDNASNMFSPATAYNWRIRPLYNLMRWAKSIFPSYAIITNTVSKIFFSQGAGNYLASGSLNAADDCRLENKTLAENADLTVNDFDDPLVPIWKPETIDFEYPLSVADYKLIKASPYGYINLQCGQGNYQKAYIKSINYKPAEGKAQFNLLLKWQ